MVARFQATEDKCASFCHNTNTTSRPMGLGIARVTWPPCTSLIPRLTELAKFWHILADSLRITWGRQSEIIHLRVVKFWLRTVVRF